MSDEIKDIKYTAKEFFNDQSFEDYDIVEQENFNKRVKKDVNKMQLNVGMVVASRLMEMGPVLKEFREYLEISEDDLFKILKGEYKELDLRLICKMETFLEIEILKVKNN